MAEGFEQVCEDHPADTIELVIRARPRDLGGFEVRRALPSMRRRMVGPFIFFDHLGPADVAPGGGMDVRPHPHIALATVTYLFEGTIFHRDSLGSAQAIHPGDVNWMIAGRGIVHSERTLPDVRASGYRAHGIQAWVALRKSEEEGAPAFKHHPASALPRIQRDGLDIRLIAGNAFGAEAPVETATPTIYADVTLAPGALLELPDGYAERAVYVATGDVACEGESFSEATMIVFATGKRACVRGGEAGARVMILGGDPIDGERFIWWNFVASSKDRIERAKADWREGRFPKVPGDETEFIPLPEP
jgi:redox-sensitive bicupin YhaK (pirin superfamily)